MIDPTGPPPRAVQATAPLSETDAAAEWIYYELNDLAGFVTSRLSCEPDPASRAALLDTLAGLESGMAAMHHAAFGSQPNADENGRDVAESIATSARVLRVLAELQHARAESRPRRALDPDLEQHAVDLLDALADPGRDDNAQIELLADLYDRWEPVIGGQAAETVSTVLDSHSDVDVMRCQP